MNRQEMIEAISANSILVVGSVVVALVTFEISAPFLAGLAAATIIRNLAEKYVDDRESKPKGAGAPVRAA